MTRISSHFDFLPLLTRNPSGASCGAPSVTFDDRVLQHIDALAKAVASPKKGSPKMPTDDARLLGLLAILLRDGGQFADKHGPERAVEAAVSQWYRDQIELETLRAHVQMTQKSERHEIGIAWNEIRLVTDSPIAAVQLANGLLALGFRIAGFVESV